MEIKGAWKAWWAARGGVGIYESYLYSPLKPVMKKSHTAANDVLKLNKLTSGAAQHAAFLLIGFDAASDPMHADVTELARLTGLDRLPWSAWHESWSDPNRIDEYVRCWLWRRPVVAGEPVVEVRAGQ